MASQKPGRGPGLAHLRHRPLAPLGVFIARILRNGFLALIMIGSALAIGVVGYRAFEGMDWIDALLNASMILTGMGPAATLTTVPGKLFASGYALFSGIAFLTSVAVLLGPLAQRFLHRFHLDLYERSDTDQH